MSVAKMSSATPDSSAKKMKQMRLPFGVIDKNVAKAKMEAEVKKSEEESKKRKASTSSTEGEAGKDDAQVKVKLGSAKKKAKKDIKENEEVIVLSDDESEVAKEKVKEVEESKPEIVEVESEDKVQDSEMLEKPEVVEIPEATPEVFKTPEPSMKRKSESTPEVSSEKVKKLTPKQLAYKEKLDKQREEKLAKKEAEKQAKEAERLREKERKEAEKQREKERKEAEKQQEKERKEAEKKAKEAQKEAEKLEKERLKQEKEAEKQKEKERKEAEKKAKEAQKEADKLQKEEQAKRKQEEKEEKEKAEKAKAEKAKQTFANFFVKKQKVEEPVEVKSENSIFTQFQVKSNMKVAPILRVEDKPVEDLELNTDLPLTELYLNKLIKGLVKPQKQGRTWPYESKLDDDIEILEDEEDEDDIGEEILNESIKPTEKKIIKKAKLLQFHDNQRPAYFGTWTKKTTKISGRKPFGEDTELFDYEYDSDDDWEEEEQGESLSDEEKDKEEDEKEDEEKLEEDDDGFFVGHGVLDKDELRNDEDDEEAFDEELEMKKQKLKAQQFEEEYKKKKPTKLKPRVFGCFWNDPSHAYDQDDQVRVNHESFIKILTPFKAVVLQLGLIQTSLSKPKVEEKESPSTVQPPKVKTLKEFPESAMLDLIKLVHANTNNKLFLAREFVEYWSSKDPSVKLSQQLTLKKLQEIADYQKSEALGRRCWQVKEDVLKSFNVMEPEIPNKWEYLLEVPKKAVPTPSTTPSATPSTPSSSTPTKNDKEELDANATPKTSIGTPKVSSKAAKAVPSPALLITKFTKVLTEDERQEQLKALRESKPKPANPAPNPQPSTPKSNQPTIIDLTKN